MTEQEYIAQRVDGNINWYNKKAMANKQYHIASKMLIMVLSATIPVITLIQFDLKPKDIIIATIGAAIAILTGLSGLMSYQEKWTGYRSAAEELVHLKTIYLTKTGDYKDRDFDYFVSAVEDVLKGERAAWEVHTSSG